MNPTTQRMISVPPLCHGDASCCPVGKTPVIFGPGNQFYVNFLPNRCLVMGEGNDSVLDFGLGTVIVGGPGNDLLQSFNALTVFANQGVDVVQNLIAPSTIVPGWGGAKVLSQVGPNVSLVYNDPCEYAAGTLLTAVGINNTLILPTSLSEAQAAGLTVGGFQTIIENEPHTESSECRIGCTGAHVALSGASSPVQGRFCLSVDWGCSEPLEAELLLDGQVRDSRVTGHERPFQIEGPSCFDTNGLSNGPHAVQVRSVCPCDNGATKESEASLTFETVADAFSIDGVELDPYEVRLGDTITLTVRARIPGLQVTADFAALDSDYVAGDEQVDDLGDGRYRITYTVSPGNTRSVGRYEATVRVENGAIERMTAVSLTFLPRRHNPVRVSGLSSFFVPESPPLGGNSVLEIADIILDGPPALRVGDTLRVRGLLANDEPLPTPFIRLLVAEDGSDGVHAVVADLISECNDGFCVHVFELDLEVATAALEEGEAEDTLSLRIAAVDGSGEASGWEAVPDLIVGRAFPLGPLTQHAIRGEIHIEYWHREPDLSNPHPQSPQFEFGINEKRTQPLSEAQVRLVDGCGGVDLFNLDSQGKFNVTFQTQCPEEEVSLIVLSRSANVCNRVDVRRFDETFYEFTLPQRFVPGSVPPNAQVPDINGGVPMVIPLDDAGPYSVLDVFVEGQNYFGWWLFGLISTRMPDVQAIYEKDFVEPGNCSESQLQRCVQGTCIQNNTSRAGDRITVASISPNTLDCTPAIGQGGLVTKTTPEVRQEWERSILGHEYGHWIQKRFMREGQTNDLDNAAASNRFGEGWGDLSGVFLRSSKLTFSGGKVVWAIATPWFVDKGIGPADNSDGKAIRAINYETNGRVRPSGEKNCAGVKVATGVTQFEQGQISFDGTTGCGQSGQIAQLLWDFSDAAVALFGPPEPVTKYTDVNGQVVADLGAFFDMVNGNFLQATMDVLFGYIGGDPVGINPAYNPKDPNRGPQNTKTEEGYLELTDVLDGYFCREHASETQMQPLLEAMQYQYVFQGPAPGACP